MALHDKHSIQATQHEAVYASSDLSVSAPKYTFPQGDMDPRHAYQIIADELLLDGNARQNLATFVQTWEEPEIHKLMDLSLQKNMIDKDEYPQTAEIERRCVHMVADLWNAPDSTNTMGTSTIGSSEAAMLGGLAAKWRWRTARKAQGKPTDQPNMVCGAVQVCWEKFARYWDIELRQVPMAKERFKLTPDEVIRCCDENTMLVVPTLGLTFTLQYEPVQQIADALDTLAQQTGWDIPIHVDAASGGFLAPFIQPALRWDFRLPRVKSINASGHKFGLAPIGCGWVVWRDIADLPEELIFWVNYLGGNMPTFQLNFSRPAGQVISQYYAFIRFGRQGYHALHQSCYKTATYLADNLEKLGVFNILYDGRGGIPGVTWTLKEGAHIGATLYDLSDRLRGYGWQLPAYSLPENAQDIVVQRVLVRQGFSRDLASALLDDIQLSLDYFRKNPVSTPLLESEAGGYKHG